jgi:hypothetical protein
MRWPVKFFARRTGGIVQVQQGECVLSRLSEEDLK